MDRLRLGEHLIDGVDGAAGHARRLQRLHQLLHGEARRLRRDQRTQRLALGDPQGVGGEAVLDLQPQGAAQGAELAVVAHGDDHHPVGTGEGLIGGQIGMGVAHPRRRLAGHEVVGRLIGQHGRLNVEQGDVDVLALAGRARVPQGGQYGVGGVKAGEQVNDRHPDLHRLGARRAVRLAGDRHQPAHGLDHVVVAGPVRVRPILAETGDGAIDQLRIDRRQRGVVEAVLLQPAGLEVLDHHVAGRGQTAHGLGAFRAGDIQLDRLLAPVHGVAHDVQFAGDPGPAVHVAGLAGDGQGLAAVVALHQADGLGNPGARIQQAAQGIGALEAEEDLGLHVGQLLLHQLARRQRAAEQGALGHIVAAGVEAELRRAHRPPGDAETRLVQAGERPAQTLHARQDVGFRHEDVVQADVAGDRGAKRQLVADLARGEAVEVALDDEAPDGPVQLGPDDGQVGDGRVGDPVFAAVQAIAAVDRHRRGLHRGRVRPPVGLGQAETADQFARRHLGQELRLLLFRAISKNRVDHERGLHAHHRTIAGVDTLDFACYQTVGDVRRFGTAVLFRQHGAEEAHLAHLRHDGAVERLVTEGGDDARQQGLARIGPRRVLNHPLLVRRDRTRRDQGGSVLYRRLRRGQDRRPPHGRRRVEGPQGVAGHSPADRSGVSENHDDSDAGRHLADADGGGRGPAAVRLRRLRRLWRRGAGGRRGQRPAYSRLSGSGSDAHRTDAGPDRRERLLVHLRPVSGRPAAAGEDGVRQADFAALFAGGERRHYLRRLGDEPGALHRHPEAALRPVAGRGRAERHGHVHSPARLSGQPAPSHRLVRRGAETRDGPRRRHAVSVASGDRATEDRLAGRQGCRRHDRGPAGVPSPEPARQAVQASRRYADDLSGSAPFHHARLRQSGRGVPHSGCAEGERAEGGVSDQCGPAGTRPAVGRGHPRRWA
uniref:LigA n=1 Tax=Parastrongyloides trichosuri TaxID=131310 RepID=A0A0N4Z3S3_PARTI